MQASYSAFIECHGEYSAAANLLKEITDILSKYEGKDDFSLKTSLEDSSYNHRPTIWLRATGSRDAESMGSDGFINRMNKHIRGILNNSYEGISSIYAKTVSIDPIDDDFFIPEVAIVEYNTDHYGIVDDEVLTYVSDEVVF